jgi:hypothetical protein
VSFAGCETRRLFKAKITAKRPENRFRFYRNIARRCVRLDEFQYHDVKEY